MREQMLHCRFTKTSYLFGLLVECRDKGNISRGWESFHPAALPLKMSRNDAIAGGRNSKGSWWPRPQHRVSLR